MTHAKRWTLGSLVALALFAGSPSAARAGMNPQGMNPQGMNPQGMNPQGMNPQGMNPQGISLDAQTLDSLGFLDGSVASGTFLMGDMLVTNKDGVFLAGTDLAGATFPGTMIYEDGSSSASQEVTLYIAQVQLDATTNSMVCDPQNPTGPRPCARNDHLNNDVYLYQVYYWVGDLADAPEIAPLCRGDQVGMFFAGSWDEHNAWVDDPTKITFACSDGVLAKCARRWGYKPWRSMTDKHGNTTSLRPYHQACLRAASADYAGTGYSFTVTGTMIDLFDNGGFNVPETPRALQTQGFASTERFESIFTHSRSANSIKPDFWGAWMLQPRFADMPLWTGMYGYRGFTWGDESPKTNLFQDYTPADVVRVIDNHYPSPEVAVFNPIWSAVGTPAATGSTVDSFDHESPALPCAPRGNAPDRAHRWVAPQAGTYRFSTAGSSFDTVLYAYANHAQVACNDDYGGQRSSQITLTVTAGQELTVFVDGYGSASGSYQLNIVKM